jgi:hypothetical protein
MTLLCSFHVSKQTSQAFSPFLLSDNQLVFWHSSTNKTSGGNLIAQNGTSVYCLQILVWYPQNSHMFSSIKGSQRATLEFCTIRFLQLRFIWFIIKTLLIQAEKFFFLIIFVPNLIDFFGSLWLNFSSENKLHDSRKGAPHRTLATQYNLSAFILFGLNMAPESNVNAFFELLIIRNARGEVA